MHRAFSIFAATAIIAAPGSAIATPASPQTSPTTTSSPFGHTGQPDQSCEDLGNQPGNAGSIDNTGSAFSENGQAGTVYAGNQPGINDKNDHSVSQYDVACAVNQSPIG